MSFKPFSFLRNIFSQKPIRQKLLITLVILIVFRLTAHIPAAGINREQLANIFSGNAFFALLDIFSGGTLGNFSILALGLNPYINASIILQLFTYISPRLEELQEEGEYGQEKINQYTRFLTVPLAALQSFTVYFILQKQGVIGVLSPIALLALVVTMTAGTMFAVWLGELITEYGIGNGVSFLIFAGIVSRLPLSFGQTISSNFSTHALSYLIVVVLSVLIIALVVFVSDAVRRVTIQYSRRSRRSLVLGDSTYLPLKLNHAGVIPIIFAVSLVVLPSVIGQFLIASGNPSFSQFAGQMLNLFRADGAFYTITYFVLVVGFTYFYTSVNFKPEKIAERLQKNGAFVPGIRPGDATAKHLSNIMSRITLFGAFFLGFIAVMPSVVQKFVQVPNLMVGGTGILIVVSVVLEVMRDLQSRLVAGRYDKFLQNPSKS